MRVIPPLSISNAMLTSSTAPEPGVNESAYNSGTTYAVGDYVILGSPTSTVTITIAAPGVITWTAHGQALWTPVVFTTTGALPTGLVANTEYYVTTITTNTFQVAAAVGGAAITTTGTQSGTHTATTKVHRVYQSLKASNLGNYPTLAASSTWWVDAGPTNQWGMFDLLRNTSTIIPSPLTVVLTPGQRVNSIALLGVVANSVTVSITSVLGGGTVYNVTTSMNSRNTIDWYSYFFEPFSTNPSLVFFDLPPYSDAIITVTLTATSGNVWLGSLCLGTYVALGSAQYNAVSDVLNFSTIARDIYGNSTLTPRRNVPKTVQKCRIEKTSVNKIIALRTLLNAVPAVWSGLDDVTDLYANSLLILGIYKAFSINIDLPTNAEINLELEEV